MPRLSREKLVCELLWALGRRHGWSRDIIVADLVNDTDAVDKKRARSICRNELSKFPSVTHHPGHDTLSLDVPHKDVCKHLRDHCEGYSELRIEATFKIENW